MVKRVLVILGHPDKDSFCGSLKKAYVRGLRRRNVKVKVINVSDLDFDPVLWKGYKEIQELEPGLRKAQRDILWAEHIVWVYPAWWGFMPSLLKGFLDRIILPGFAFRFKQGSHLWRKFLKGRSSHLIITMDTPPIVYKFLFGAPGIKLMKRLILGFTGIKVNRVTLLGSVKKSSLRRRKKWLMKVEKLGEKAR